MLRGWKQAADGHSGDRRSRALQNNERQNCLEWQDGDHKASYPKWGPF